MSKRRTPVKIRSTFLFLTASAASLAAPRLASAQESSEFIEFTGFAGVNVRADDAPVGETTERAGVVGGVGAGLSVSRLWTLGLAYERASAGGAELAFLPYGYATLDWVFDTAWLELAAVYREEAWEVGVPLSVGLAFQHVEGTGIVPQGLGDSPLPASCSGSDSASLAIAGALMGGLRVAGPVWLTTRMRLVAPALSDEVLDQCAAGAGSALLPTLQLGVSYRIGL